MHEPGHEPLQKLPLAEDDHRLVPYAAGKVVEAVDWLACADEPIEEKRAPREQAAADDQCGRQRERTERDCYAPLALRSSAEIAGTISCRSPITA